MKPWILGLTGGIGSGKSAVANHFNAQGIHTVDADHAARWVVEPGQPALERIRQHFGDSMVREDGSLDRAALRQHVFSNPEERRWLEQLLHPLINQALRDNLEQARSPYAILVSPLLIESGQQAMTQRILLIDTPEHLQLQRTVERDGVSPEQVQAILQAQAKREERLRHAHDIIVNDRELDWLHREVERLHAYYLSLRAHP